MTALVVSLFSKFFSGVCKFMSADKDRDSLLDPRNPHSPYNRFNYDSPYSFENPLSSHYNRNDAAIAFLGKLSVVGFLVLTIGTTILINAFPFWTAVCFFAGIPGMCVLIYLAGKYCEPQSMWIAWSLIFLIGFGVLMIEIAGRMDGTGSGLVWLWHVASTNKPYP